MLLLTGIIALFQTVAPLKMPQYWLEIASRISPRQARSLADSIHTRRHEGNRMLQVLIVDPGMGSDVSDVRVWLGPFTRRAAAFTHGLGLLENAPFPVQSFSLRRTDGATVSMQVPAAARARFKLARTKPPWPQIGVALAPRVTGFLHPFARLPRLSAATVTLGYRDEVWIQDQTEVCEDRVCRRWFYAVTPAPHRLAWFPAGQVIPVDGIRSHRNPEGKLERYTAVVRTGSSDGIANGLAMSFLGSRRPMRWVFQKKGFSEGRLRRQEDGTWSVLTRSGPISLGRSPAWYPVESLFRSSGRRQFF